MALKTIVFKMAGYYPRGGGLPGNRNNTEEVECEEEFADYFIQSGNADDVTPPP